MISLFASYWSYLSYFYTDSGMIFRIIASNIIFGRPAFAIDKIKVNYANSTVSLFPQKALNEPTNTKFWDDLKVAILSQKSNGALARLNQRLYVSSSQLYINRSVLKMISITYIWTLSLLFLLLISPLHWTLL